MKINYDLLRPTYQTRGTLRYLLNHKPHFPTGLIKYYPPKSIDVISTYMRVSVSNLDSVIKYRMSNQYLRLNPETIPNSKLQQVACLIADNDYSLIPKCKSLTEYLDRLRFKSFTLLSIVRLIFDKRQNLKLATELNHYCLDKKLHYNHRYYCHIQEPLKSDVETVKLMLELDYLDGKVPLAPKMSKNMSLLVIEQAKLTTLQFPTNISLYPLEIKLELLPYVNGGKINTELLLQLTRIRPRKCREGRGNYMYLLPQNLERVLMVADQIAELSSKIKLPLNYPLIDAILLAYELSNQTPPKIYKYYGIHIGI